jgi:hypothetical protein
MKRTIFLSLVISVIIGSCTQEKKSPIEGAWQLVYAQWQPENMLFPSQVKGSDIKIWSNDYFAAVGKITMDTVITNLYVGGKYTLEGNRYEEDILYHTFESLNGQKVKLLLEIRNDTLIQQWPANEDWKLEEVYSTEKYVRLK